MKPEKYRRNPALNNEMLPVTDEQIHAIFDAANELRKEYGTAICG